jgi:hypothetical protein
MFKKLLLSIFALILLAPALFADEISDQAYINQLNYRHNKLELTTKTRVIDESRSYSSTDISSTTQSYEAFSQTYGNIETSSLQRTEQKEVTEWYIYKGGVERISDLEFLKLIDDRARLDQARQKQKERDSWRLLGNVSIGAGIITMLGGAAVSAGQTVVTGGAIVTTLGFFVSAFNMEPHHYIKQGYALNKIDEYNIKLKKKLNLPLDFE